MIFIEWLDTFTQGIEQFGIGFANFIPNLIAAIIIFLLGWFFSMAIGKLIAEILKKLKLDSFLEKTGWKEAMDKVDMKMTMSEFIGGLCKWILVLVFLGIAANILNLNTFSVFVLSVVSWLPKLVVAVLMFVVIIVFSNIAEKAVKASMAKAKLDYVDLVGAVVRWAIWIFGIFAILIQLGIAQELLTIIATGFVFMISGAAALAFGLGGKDAATSLIHSLREKIKK